MKNIKSIIENSDTYWGRRFDLFIQFLIFISLVTFTLETLPNIPPEASYWLRILEVATVCIFTLEYLLRIFVADNKLRFIFSFYGIIDFFAILPFYLTIGVDLRSIRIFRLLRLIRIFKILRFSRVADRFQKAFFLIKDELWVFATTTLFLLYISSVGIYHFENAAQPENYQSIFHSLWWSIVTLTTVGYGDVYPITLGGRIFTSFILIIGLGVVAVPTGLISSALSETYDSDDKIENMSQKEVKTEKRIEFLDKILSVMESHELFSDLVSRKNDTEAQVQKVVFLRLQKKLPLIIQSTFGYNTKQANKIVDTQFVWEQEKKISVKNFPFFATNHRPDAQLVVDNLRIGIEIQKGDNEFAVRSGIGQSVVYSTQFDFVLYFFIDISKGLDIKSSTSALKEEAELIQMLWDSFNIRFHVV